MMDEVKRNQGWATLVDEVDLARVAISVKQILVLTGLGTVLLGWLHVTAMASPLAVILAVSVPGRE
jgi:hypothetical protein